MSRPPTPLMVRLMAKVIESETGCWEFTGKLSNTGYGCIWSGPGGRVIFAHRAAFELYRADIPDGMSLDHLCRNTKCCNPWHVEVVDHRTNMLRGVGFSAINAAKTHCDSGHAFDVANTYTTPDGKRKCRECGRANARRYNRQRKESNV